MSKVRPPRVDLQFGNFDAVLLTDLPGAGYSVLENGRNMMGKAKDGSIIMMIEVNRQCSLVLDNSWLRFPAAGTQGPFR